MLRGAWSHSQGQHCTLSTQQQGAKGKEQGKKSSCYLIQLFHFPSELLKESEVLFVYSSILLLVWQRSQLAEM